MMLLLTLTLIVIEPDSAVPSANGGYFVGGRGTLCSLGLQTGENQAMGTVELVGPVGAAEPGSLRLALDALKKKLSDEEKAAAWEKLKVVPTRPLTSARVIDFKDSGLPRTEKTRSSFAQVEILSGERKGQKLWYECDALMRPVLVQPSEILEKGSSVTIPDPDRRVTISTYKTMIPTPGAFRLLAFRVGKGKEEGSIVVRNGWAASSVAGITTALEGVLGNKTPGELSGIFRDNQAMWIRTLTPVRIIETAETEIKKPLPLKVYAARVEILAGPMKDTKVWTLATLLHETAESRRDPRSDLKADSRVNKNP